MHQQVQKKSQDIYAVGKKTQPRYLDSWAWERTVIVWENCLISPLVQKAGLEGMIWMTGSERGVQALWTDSQRMC